MIAAPKTAPIKRVLDKVGLISLFSGAGGLDFAFGRTGRFHTCAYVEREQIYSETLKENVRRGLLSPGAVFNRDLFELDPVDIMERNDLKNELIGLIGGPPCESYSMLGKQRGTQDRRGLVLFEFARWARDAPFHFFLMENVPGLLTIDNGKIFRRFVKQTEEAGYKVSYRVLRACDYGAATIRRRVFVVGMRNDKPFRFPVPTHARNADIQPSLLDRVLNWNTAGKALAGLPRPSSKPPGEINGHFTVKHAPEIIERFGRIRPGTVDDIRKRNRLSLDMPAPGLYAGNHKGVRAHIHPTEPRELTNRECARIQGFPDEYYFAGSHAPMGKQIANAVPIELGEALARALLEQLAANRMSSFSSSRDEPLSREPRRTRKGRAREWSII